MKTNSSVKVYHSPVFGLFAASGRPVPVSEFVKAALYHPVLGYYRSNKKRVGLGGADFFTSESMPQKTFGRLVKEAVLEIARSKSMPEDETDFAEIGVEAEAPMDNLFRPLRLGDEISIRPRSAVVSNELLDAQPFDIFVFSGSVWRKIFICANGPLPGAENPSYEVSQIFFDASERESEILDKYFGKFCFKGFRAEFSAEALEIFSKICAQNPGGICLFADYFRSAQELSAFGEGTARTYRSHKCGGDIFEDAGLRDITFSPCSDMFVDEAKRLGFKEAGCLSQEKFFLSHAAGEIRNIVENSSPLDPRKRELCQLLNPSLMGSLFRVLYAY